MANKTKNYDAIIVGGGHNGLTNGAYLAKAGLKVLIIERRHLVGGAAITEELRPGFNFTTFSYALSLLRPDIIQELDLVKHGFMPILMPSSFAPMENGDYLLLGQDRDENIKEILRHSPHDADAMDRYEYDMERVCQVVKPLFDKAPPNIFGKSPEDLADLAELAGHLRGVEPKVMHDLVRLLTGSVADFLDDYFESDILKGYIASSGIIGTKVGPMSQGSGLVLLFHSMGEHDGHFGSWAFHKGGNGGFTQVLARAAQAYGAEIMLNSPVDSVITKDGEAVGVALEDGTEFHAPVVVSALDPRRTFTQLVEPRELPERARRDHRPLQVPGHVGQGQLRPRRPAEVPGARRPQRPVPRLRQHRAVDGVPRAGLRRREVRLVQPAALHRRRDPVDRRPGHGASRQARDELLHPVRALPPQGQRLGQRARWTSATPCSAPSSRSSPVSATWCCTARSSRRSTSSGSPASPRATSSTASSSRRRCTSSARRRAGASTGRRSRATTSAAPARTPAAA